MNNILIIEPSSAGLELIPTAKLMGLNVFVFSANKDERIIPDNFRNYINSLIVIDTYDLDLIYHAARKINQIHQFSAIIPGSEYHVPISSQLSDLMKLPGVSPKHVDALRFKNKMRECLKKNNVRCPQYVVVTSENDILNIKKNIIFPCVIKPIASAGSMHVSRANNFDELFQAYRAMCIDTWTELGIGVGSTAIIEEYIDGEEFSIEGYIENSQARFISITKKILSPEPLFIEMGHIVSAKISTEKQQLIEAYIQEVITALNIGMGVFHAELRVDHRGPVLMEIAGRLPGCRVCDLIQLARGVNFYEIMIRSYIGLPIKAIEKPIQQYAGMCYFELNGMEKFTHINGLDKLRKLAGFVEFKLLKKPGEYIPPLTNFTGRVATCILTAPTYDEIKSRLDLAKSLITFS